MVSSPVYQIDFTVLATGKHIATTKRRIRWRWGFTNHDALAAGLSGTACRGEEHDVAIVWSLVSGKCNVLADGQEVHMCSNRAGPITCSWTMKGNHVLQVIAHALTPTAPGMRQYDFLVDGQSFFEMPKVFNLGLQGGSQKILSDKTLPVAISSRQTSYPNYPLRDAEYPTAASSSQVKNLVEIEAPRNVDEEEAFLAEAIRASLVESKNPPPLPTPTVTKNEDLILNFFDDPQPAYVSAPAPSYNGTEYRESHHLASQAPPAPTQLFASPAPIYTPAPPPPVTYASAPVSVPVSSTAYSSAPPVSTMPNLYPKPVPPPTLPQPSSVPPGPPVSLYQSASQPASKGLGSDANKAFEKLATMDLLGTGTATKRMNPFDTAGPSLNSLAEMKGAIGNGTAQAISQPTSSFDRKPIMNNATTSPPSSSRMVVSSTQQGNWGGYGGMQNTVQSQQQQQTMLGHGYGQSGYNFPMASYPQGHTSMAYGSNSSSSAQYASTTAYTNSAVNGQPQQAFQTPTGAPEPPQQQQARYYTQQQQNGYPW